jgi:hypothetical protein
MFPLAYDLLNFYHPVTRKARKIKGPLSTGPFVQSLALRNCNLESIASPETAVAVIMERIDEINMDVS